MSEVAKDILSMYPGLQAKAPVRFIAKDDPHRELVDEIGLCMSGGGYRAMLFHLGTLWRLNELGLLPKLGRISSVSGGSITSGYLAYRWKDLKFGQDGVATNFAEVVVTGLRRVARHTIDVWSVVTGLFVPAWVGTRVAAYYDQYLFEGATLQALPDAAAPGLPCFVLNATSLQTGNLWRFTRAYMGDWRVGLYDNPTIPLARAVAASSSFPPILSPTVLKLDPKLFRTNLPGVDLDDPAYRSKVVLVDGGVYDNLGLETIWKRCKTVLVSDGGSKVAADAKPWFLRLLQTIRVSMIMDQQIGDLRIRQLIESYKLGTANRTDADDASLARAGAYWGIGSKVKDFHLPDPLEFPEAEANLAARTPTRLKALLDKDQERLINWGYVICDTAIRKYYNPGGKFTKPKVLPYLY